MNFPDIDTCVCDASAAEDADAHASQICPRPEEYGMLPNGTSRKPRAVSTKSGYG